MLSSSSVFLPIQDSPPSYHRVKLNIATCQEHQTHHTRNDAIKEMKKSERKLDKTENSNNSQGIEQRPEKLGTNRSPKDKRKQEKTVDYTAYLPPVRAPGGKN